MGVLALAVPVHAQKGRAKEPSPEEIQRKREAAELDQKYKAAIKSQRDADTSAKKDPWANMRAPAGGKPQ
jgi:hypothetical protein